MTSSPPRRSRTCLLRVAPLAFALTLPAPLRAQATPPPAATPSQRVPSQELAPPLAPLVTLRESELREVVQRYSTDRAALGRRYEVEMGVERRERFRDFYRAWQQRLGEVDFEPLSAEGRIDHVLLSAKLRYELSLLDREEKQLGEMRRWAPFLERLTALQERRRRMEPVDAPATARELTAVARAIDSARTALEATPRSDTARAVRIVAYRASNALDGVRRGAMTRWYNYYAGYDPSFTWWMQEPYKRTDAALARYVKVLRERVVGWKEGEEEPIIGDPIGADGLAADLAMEMIPYTPQELIAIAEREYAWCEAEMKKASREMGFGDDWKAALEKVKNTYVEPGQQPELIRHLAFEATDFVESRGLVTVPALAKEVWRMEMMTPERQKVAPFFLGGEVIQVAFPTDGMETEDKMMSLRGNNPHFSRAVAHHELIPGHHLQGFMTARYNTHRGAFSTPFWGEGWALYWEFLLWDAGFARSAEDRVGMLFWRMHRAARIMFSLGVHLGTWTPDQAIDFLVDRVGHERANAEGEVRRSFNGSYSPAYQAAYMLGALQFRALNDEVVKSGRMQPRAFHDLVLQGGRMPVEMVRARVLQEKLAKDHRARWRFYGDPSRKPIGE